MRIFYRGTELTTFEAHYCIKNVQPIYSMIHAKALYINVLKQI